MKRILLATKQGSGTRGDPVRPVLPVGVTAAVVLHEFPNRMLVKVTLPDGTAKTPNTIADITIEQDADGTQRQIDINAEALNAAQRTTIRTFLAAQGFDIAQFDGDDIQDRARLLRFVLRRLAGWRDLSTREVLNGWDA